MKFLGEIVGIILQGVIMSVFVVSFIASLSIPILVALALWKYVS